MTGAHGDLLAGWDKEAGPETARKMMRAAIDEWLGVEEPILVDGKPLIGKDGHPLTHRVSSEAKFKAILPFIARKMPETFVELEGEELSPEEIDRIWAKRQDRKK